MRRSDLSWALSAVLPHAGKGKPFTDCVGLTTRGGTAYLFATDNYTSGVARIDTYGDLELDVRMTSKEAVELERFVRPSYRDEEAGALTFDTRDLELHVGLERQIHRDGSTEPDSSVFDVIEHSLSLGLLLGVVEALYQKPASLDGLVFQSTLAAKFAKAQRAEFERTRFYPRSTRQSGAAVVTVGTNFVGMVAGLTDDPADSTVTSFLRVLREGAAA